MASCMPPAGGTDNILLLTDSYKVSTQNMQTYIPQTDCLSFSVFKTLDSQYSINIMMNIQVVINLDKIAIYKS